MFPPYYRVIPDQLRYYREIVGLSTSGALNEELLETSYNVLEIYQNWGSLLVIK